MDRAEARAGEAVLIPGDTGVAGRLAIQAAPQFGARRLIGAGGNIEAIESGDVDAVVALGGPFATPVSPRPLLVEIGESAKKTINLPGATLHSLDLTLLGSGFGFVPLDKVLSAVLSATLTLFSLAASGELKVAVETVPLAGMGKA